MPPRLDSKLEVWFLLGLERERAKGGEEDDVEGMDYVKSIQAERERARGCPTYFTKTWIRSSHFFSFQPPPLGFLEPLGSLVGGEWLTRVQHFGLHHAPRPTDRPTTSFRVWWPEGSIFPWPQTHLISVATQSSALEPTHLMITTFLPATPSLTRLLSSLSSASSTSWNTIKFVCCTTVFLPLGGGGGGGAAAILSSSLPPSSRIFLMRLNAKKEKRLLAFLRAFKPSSLESSFLAEDRVTKNFFTLHPVVSHFGLLAASLLWLLLPLLRPWLEGGGIWRPFHVPFSYFANQIPKGQLVCSSCNRWLSPTWKWLILARMEPNSFKPRKDIQLLTIFFFNKPGLVHRIHGVAKRVKHVNNACTLSIYFNWLLSIWYGLSRLIF